MKEKLEKKFPKLISAELFAWIKKDVNLPLSHDNAEKLRSSKPLTGLGLSEDEPVYVLIPASLESGEYPFSF